MYRSKTGQIYDDPDDTNRPANLVGTIALIMIGAIAVCSLVFQSLLLLIPVLIFAGYHISHIVLRIIKWREKKQNTEYSKRLRAHIVAGYILLVDALAFCVLISLQFDPRYAIVVTGWLAIGIVAFGAQQWHARRSYLKW